MNSDYEVAKKLVSWGKAEKAFTKEPVKLWWDGSDFALTKGNKDGLYIERGWTYLIDIYDNQPTDKAAGALVYKLARIVDGMGIRSSWPTWLIRDE